MKNCLLLLAVLSAFIYPQKEEKADSKVISATVFKNRALVTREAGLNLSKGKHKIIFSNLPADLENESVRISSSGPGIIKILDVKVEQRFTTEVQQKNIKDLEEEIDSLNQLVIVASDEIALLNSKKEFVEGLKAQASKYINEKMMMNLASSKDWSQMLTFVERNLSEIYKGLRVQNRAKTLIEQKINAIRAEIAQSQGVKTKNYKEVIVIVEMDYGGDIKLLPSYIVQSAGWYPIYDARVSSQKKEVGLYYFGMIQQSTGEDWEDISLTLSTAEPMSIKSLPELERWFVDVRPLPVKRNYSDVNQTINPNYQVTYDQNWGLPSGTGSVTGYIIDRKTGEPLAGANVVVEGTSSGSSADLTGKFLISNVNAGEHNIRVSMIGYETLRMGLNVIEKNAANVTFPLQAQNIVSNEVVVTAEKIGMRNSINYSL
ncbi:MAG TPA: mucoidy inhibitor MuiA family protein, partial [Ignavibacteriaceae bacterium]|nr:mucoidy inhibitor MuiA family protein [Ignavibacteriaceae bacterium]